MMQDWEFRDSSVAVKLPSSISQVQVLIRPVITLIVGLTNPISQGVCQILHIRWYPPHHSYCHPRSRSLLSITQSASLNTMLSYPSLSIPAKIISCHQVVRTSITAYFEYSKLWVQHTLSTAYFVYSILRLQHTLRTAYFEYSIHWRLFLFPSFSWLQVDPWMQLRLRMYLPTWSTAIRQLSLSTQW